MPSGRLLNFASPVNQSISGKGDGTRSIVAELPAVPFDRLLYRVILQTTLDASDLVSGTWNSMQSTVPTFLVLNSLSDAGSVVDYTPLGDANVAEYLYPIRIPQKTAFYVWWKNVKPSSAGKAMANLALVTA